jgi:eukaryotic-like serine/threonine-protein kinase
MVMNASTSPLSGRYQLAEAAYGDASVVVHRGYDQLLNRNVAIELPHPGQPNAHIDTMLREKARRMAIGELPFVAALYDQGDEADRPYLILEELVGEPLSDTAPLPPSAVVELFSSLATTVRSSQQTGRRREKHLRA